MRAKTVVSRVAPMAMRKIPKTRIPVDWPANEKSPNPTVEMVSTVKYRAVSDAHVAAVRASGTPAGG